MMYPRQTGKKEYLDQAVKIGKYIMNHPRLPKDKIPYWDFDAPDIPKADRDASPVPLWLRLMELSTYVEGELCKQFLAIGRTANKVVGFSGLSCQESRR